MLSVQGDSGSLKFSRYYRQFSNKNAFSNRTLFVLAFVFIGTNLTLDFGRLNGSFFQWFVVSAAGYLAFVIGVLLLRTSLKNFSIPDALYLPIYFALGLIRGVAIFQVGMAIGIITADDLSYRLVGSGIFTFCVMPIATILVSNFDRANKTLAELKAQTMRRTNRLNSMKVEIAEQKAEISGRVSGLLMPVITDLMQRVKAAKSSDIGKQISALRNTVDNVVRPLSMSVANEGTNLSDPQVELVRASVLDRLNPRTKYQVGQLFLPSLSAFLLTLICSTPIISIGGIQVGGLILLSLALATFVILQSIKFLTRNVQLTLAPALGLVLLGYLSVSGVVLLAIAIVEDSLIPISIPRLVSLNVIFGCVFFIAQSRYQLLNQATQSLEEVNLELALLNAQAKQELWINRRRVASVLHGPVQAALYASAIRLSQAKKPSKKLLAEVTGDLEEALTALRFEAGKTGSVKSILSEIVDVWSGVCDIYLNIPKEIYDVTKRNPLAAESFVEITREATSNAIKHGSATEIEVIAKITRGVIQLKVVNNGKAPTKQEASTGYGTQILNELAIDWSLDNSGDKKVIFTANIVATI